MPRLLSTWMNMLHETWHSKWDLSGMALWCSTHYHQHHSHPTTIPHSPSKTNQMCSNAWTLLLSQLHRPNRYEKQNHLHLNQLWWGEHLPHNHNHKPGLTLRTMNSNESSATMLWQVSRTRKDSLSPGKSGDGMKTTNANTSSEWSLNNRPRT